MKVLAAAAVALMVTGCAHAPVMKQPQVNRAAKADKLVVKKVEQPTPNQAIKKRWYDGFRVRWFNK